MDRGIMANELGILQARGTLASQYTAGSWVPSYGGTIAVTGTESDGGLDISGTGVLKWIGNSDFASHLLNDWWIDVTFDSNTAIASTFLAGIGLENMQTVSATGRVNLWIDGAAQTVYLRMSNDGGYPRYTVPIPTWFNWSGARCRVTYHDMLLIVTFHNAAGQTWTLPKYRYMISTKYPDGTYPALPGHQTNPVGAFALNFAHTDNTTANRITHVEIGSNSRKHCDLIVPGDSIDAGRQNYPESKRYADVLRRMFYAAGTPKDIQVMAAGGTKVEHMVQCLPSFLAMQPHAMIVKIGDNNDRNNIEAWKVLYKQFINALTAAGIHVYALALTIDPNDPHVTFAEYIMDPAGLKAEIDTPSLVTTIDTLTPQCVGGDHSIPDLQFVNADDHVHQNDLGNLNLAATIFPLLSI